MECSFSVPPARCDAGVVKARSRGCRQERRMITRRAFRSFGTGAPGERTMARRRSHRRRSTSAAWAIAIVAAAVVVAILFTAQQRAAREQERRQAEAEARAARHPAVSAVRARSPEPVAVPPSAQALAARVEEPSTSPAHFDVPPPPPGLELLDHHPEPGNACWYILGRIRNDTDTPYGYVRVRADIYDASHKRIGSASDSTAGLPAHEVWHFKILVDDPDARGYRIAGISETP